MFTEDKNLIERKDIKHMDGFIYVFYVYDHFYKNSYFSLDVMAKTDIEECCDCRNMEVHTKYGIIKTPIIHCVNDESVWVKISAKTKSAEQNEIIRKYMEDRHIQAQPLFLEKFYADLYLDKMTNEIIVIL